MTRYACIDCRKTFSLEWTQKGICSDCGEQMLETGKAFKAPPKRDKRAWKMVGLLLKAGILYHPWNMNTPHGRPTKLRDVPGWIKWYKRGPYSTPSKSTVLRRRVEDGEL